MNKIKFVMAAALLTATAACTQTGYDNSYAYNNRGYNNAYNSNGYYASDGRYYTNNRYNSGYGQPAYNTGYAGILGAILGQANNQPTYYDARRGGW